MISRKQILILVGALVLIIILMYLPKGVIQKGKSQEVVSANRDKKEESNADSPSLHEVNLASDVKNHLDSLRIEYKKTHNTSTIEQLADVYFEATLFDSAAFYYKEALKESNKLALKVKLSEAYYSIFSISEGKDEDATKNCIEVLQEIVTLSPSNLEAKSKLGYITTLTSQAPMIGVKMLKDVLKVDPNYRTALFDLGLLDIRSRQLDKAVDKFEKLIVLDKNDQLSRFYLAICYKEQNNLAKTRELVDIIAKSNANPVLVGEAQKLLVE